MGSHIFKVDELCFNIDENFWEKYLDQVCPANGFIPDPSIYEENPVITETPKPETGKIRLVVTDEQSRHVQFKCTISNAGKYVVTVIGKNDVVIETQTKNNNNVTQVTVPFGEGYVATGYTYYYVDIEAQLETNSVTVFQATINNTYDTEGGYIIAAFFNEPGITSLYQAFRLNKRIQHIEIVGTADYLTTLEQMCYQSDNVARIILPNSLPTLITMAHMCYQTINYNVKIDFPSDVPLLENIYSTFAYSNIREFTFPEYLPSLIYLNACFYGSEIERIYFDGEELPEVTTLSGFAYDCKRLKGKITYPELPKVTTIENIHANNPELTEIMFTGEADLISNIKNTASNCKKLKKITFPESMLGLVLVANTANAVSYCGELETVVMPKIMKLNTATSGEFFSSFIGCNKLHTITAVEEGNDTQWGIFKYEHLYSLKTFNQPELFFTANDNQVVNINPATGTQGVLESAELNWGCNPIYSSINAQYQNFSISEIRRIMNRYTEKEKFNEFKYFNIRYNPSYENYRIDIPLNKIQVSAHRGTITKANWDERIKVGLSALGDQSNGNPNVSYITIESANTFSLRSSHMTAPLDDTKFMTRDETYEGYGLKAWKTYYVVNSDGASDKYFQLSATKGGSPINFGFDVGLFEDMINGAVSNYVTNVIEESTYYYVYFSCPWIYNSGSRGIFLMDTDVIDLWEFMEKGFRPM